MTKKYDVDDLNGISEGLSTLSGDLAGLSEDSGKAQGALWSPPIVGAVQEFTDGGAHGAHDLDGRDRAVELTTTVVGNH